MRIAVFCNDFWPTIGGVQTAVRGLGRALLERGNEVVVLTRRPPGTAPSEIVDRIEVHRFHWNLRPRWSFGFRYVRAGHLVRETLRTFKPDVAYVHFVTVHALFARQWATAHGIPLILSFRGTDALRIAPRSMLARAVYRRLTRTADVNVFCSDWLLGQALAAPWFLGKRATTSVLADAVSVDDRTRPREPLPEVVLSAGRMVFKKGFDLLLRAWARVSDRVPGQLWIAGDGEERRSLEKLTDELDIRGRVRFLGPLAHPELLGIVERARVCIVPSREEPYGIAVLEAQALGTPVVATAVGNLPVLVKDGVTGYLVEPSVDGLAEGLVRAWQDPDRDQIVAAARVSPGASRSYWTMAGELENWARAAGKGGEAQ